MVLLWLCGVMPATQGSTNRPVEFSWFAALCDDDATELANPAAALPSSYDHCSGIVAEAARQGFDAVLLPSGYELGIDNTVFAAGVARDVPDIDLLLAIRCGELWPPQLVRQLVSLDQLCEGRLRVNLISSDLPGRSESGEVRYGRTAEVIDLLTSGLSGQPLEHHGDAFDLSVPSPRIARTDGRRLPLYFGGLSAPAREVAARGVDVYLMWPDVEEVVAATITDLRQRAAVHGRQLTMGYRVHVVVREDEAEARAAARALVASLDEAAGTAQRERSLDATSVGVHRQSELRAEADVEGYVEANLWTGIGRARSGCGAAIVGTPDQVEAKLRRYMAMGIDAFILSGYPHAEECRRFGELVLPRFDHAKLQLP